SFLGRLKVTSLQSVNRVVCYDFPVDDPVEKARQVLSHLSGTPLLAFFDQLVDQLVNVRPPDVVYRGTCPARHHMPAQDTVDVAPGAHVRDNLDIHEPSEHSLKRIDRPNEVLFPPLGPEVAALCRSLHDIASLPAGGGELQRWGGSQG